MNLLSERMELAVKHWQVANPDQPRFNNSVAARAIGCERAAISAWRLGGIKEIKSVHLFNAARYLDVSPEWLGTGKGPMLPTGDKDQRDLLKFYNSASDEGKAAILRLAHLESRSNAPVTPPNSLQLAKDRKTPA